MKFIFSLFASLSACVWCLSDKTFSVKDSGYNFEYEYVGNPDDNAAIERPCPVYDLNCIRNFFGKHAKCTIRNGPVPSPVPRSHNHYHLPVVNVSISSLNTLIFGMNETRVEEFYINRATNKVVFTIQVRNLTILSPMAYFRFYRKGMEPVTAVDFTEVLYRKPVYTAVIPNIEDMQLHKAEVTAYHNEAIPQFNIGPGILNNTDPVVMQGLAELLNDVPTSVQENMLTEPTFYPPTYIQYNICDFGLKIV